MNWATARNYKSPLEKLSSGDRKILSIEKDI